MKSPFKFLDSFTKEDREIFFGREKEIKELYQRIFQSKIMLVYGVSGTGKSSLIHCGLANKFQETDWLPLNIRRGKNILESLYAAIVSASLTPKSDYSTSEIQFKKNVRSLYLDHYKPIYFIFDQFEELFIFGSKQEKSSFVQVIKTLVDSDIQCRFIFVMREEYMANVTEFEKHIPAFFSNRVRIENMDHNNAIEAIKGPCNVFNISIEEGFSESLIKNLSPESPDIELTYLQVFLDKIYRLAVEEKTGRKSDTQVISFTLDQLNKIGDVSDLLGSFLNEQISLLDDPDTALAVLKSFVSVKGTKRQMSLDDVKEYAQTLGKPIKESVLLEMLQNFVNLRILRDKDQHERYELRHDSLATKIYEKISVVEKDILEIRQFIEDGWHNWQKRGVLLSANDLEYIAPYESRLFLSPELSNIITQSKNQLENVKRKRRVIFVAATFVLLIIFAGFTIWALIERKTSRIQEIIAKANYYNALSKELVNSDPTKALRIAEYASKLDPSENNFQNLVDIYSNNEFYYTYLPTRSFVVANFKVLKQTGNIAINSNSKILTLDPNGRIIRETNFELPLNFSFDISPDEKLYFINKNDDTLRVYDLSEKLLSKIFCSNALETYFSTDSTLVIVAVDRNTGTGKIKFWSINKGITETKGSFTNGGLIKGFSSDTVHFFTLPRDFYCWIPAEDRLIKRTLKFPGSEGINSAEFISKNTIAYLTNYDSIRICNLDGTELRSFYAGDEKNNGFYQLLVMNDLNQICIQNDKLCKIWNLNGQHISTLKLGSSSPAQYNIVNKELLILNNNQIIGYVPNKFQNELFLKKENKNSYYYPRGNNIIEKSDTKEYLISLEGDKSEKKAIKKQDDKFFYKIEGAQTVINNFPKNYKPPVEPEVVIYDINDGKPVVRLKGLTEIPGAIVFSKDENLLVSSNKMYFYEDGAGSGPTTFFSLYNKEGNLLRTFPANSIYYTTVKISSDNSNILSTDNKIAILWDTAGNKLYKYIGHYTTIRNVSISEDGNYILTGSYDKTARLWTRDGKPLKVIQTDDQYFDLYFLPEKLVFQLVERNSVKLYDINGVLLQKIPANGNPVVYTPKDRFLYYFDNEGVHRTQIKLSVDSFILSNNHNDLSITDKIGYNILSVNDILESGKPNDIYLAGRYFFDNIGKKIDISEKKYTIKTAEKLFEKGLTFDTLHGPIARSLTALCTQKHQFFGESINKEVDKYFKIMTESNDITELTNAFTFYARGTDSTTISYGYPEKAIMISEKILKLSPSETTKYIISFNCSNLSFILFDFKEQYQNSLAAVQIAIKADSTYQLSYTNLPLAYLFNNRYSDAEKEYLKWKDVKWTADSQFKTLREAFLSDFADLERRKKAHPDFGKIKELLKK
jgi:WD40 repeat protein